ncbi:hypothetical protein HanXRQr2_Chr13g0591991 [Helianthus annuus]|uniref:Uncharacterized protein n=1 Tax=Helianthus annuus TaxID=4232 RepID=A0A9K3HCT4_HELAN|nr:hypothetical protein HanXRQr2_Chr13g0591991 [Helianthus annuus]KAJ0477191.1 hypothetical protein HanHA300_Chr13g0485541 [Helianthus annuus]
MSVHRYIYTNALLANYNHLPVAGHWWLLLSHPSIESSRRNLDYSQVLYQN